MGQGLLQSEKTRCKQVFNQPSIAMLLDDHNRLEWTQPEGHSRLTHRVKQQGRMVVARGKALAGSAGSGAMRRQPRALR